MRQKIQSKVIEEKGETLLPEIDRDKFVFSQDNDDLRVKSSSQSVSWSEIESILEVAQEQSERELVAVFSLRDSTGSWYNYFVQPLGFSPEAIDHSEGGIQHFIYELDPDSLDTVPRIAVAVIPRGEKALLEFEKWILPQHNDQITAKVLDNSNYIIKDDFYCDYQEVVPGGYTCVEDGSGCEYHFPVYDTVCTGGGGPSSSWNWPTGGGGSTNDGSGSTSCPPPYYCGTPEEAPIEDDSDVDISINLEEEILILEEQFKDWMTEAEVTIYENELTLIQKFQYLRSTKEAKDSSEENFDQPCDLSNGKGDAYRHALWNALSATRIGNELTERLTNAHEDWDGNPELAKEMDLHNNAEGREIANSNSSNSLSEQVMDALLNGDLEYITNLNIIEGCKITLSSELVPTNQ